MVWVGWFNLKKCSFMCWQCIFTLESCLLVIIGRDHQVSMWKACLLSPVLAETFSWVYLIMHVYCAPLPSTLCKLAPDRWDIPVMRFCTCFSLPLLWVLYPVCDNTSNNDFLVKFQDWPVHSYICLLLSAVRAHTPQTFDIFDGQCVMPLVNPFTQKKYLLHSHGTKEPFGMKLGLSFDTSSQSRPML